MNYPPHYILRVEIRTPDGRRLGAEVEMTDFRESLGPLPRNREIVWDVDAQRSARVMMQVRRELLSAATNQISRSIAKVMEPELVKLIESQDPQHAHPRARHLPCLPP